MAKRRSGCSGFIAFVFLLCLAAAIFSWPKYLDAQGSQTLGTITEKKESVWVHYGDWHRRFEVIATFSIPGQPLEHRAGCDVDEQTYDSLHAGNRVSVHYLSSLLFQPFIPAMHLAPCTSLASVNLNPEVMRRLAIALAALAAILFLWRILRIGLAGLLLAPWFFFFFAYVAIPRAEPAPSRPIPGKATIESISTVSNLGTDQRGIPLQHPYQIVQLRFTPHGMDTPVAAIDKIDFNSVSNLQEKQTVDIMYDAEHPRIARLQAGTRLFPGQARGTVLLTSAVLLAFLLISFAATRLLRLLVRNPVVSAAKTVMRRQRRRF